MKDDHLHLEARSNAFERAIGREVNSETGTNSAIASHTDLAQASFTPKSLQDDPRMQSFINDRNFHLTQVEILVYCRDVHNAKTVGEVEGLLRGGKVDSGVVAEWVGKGCGFTTEEFIKQGYPEFSYLIDKRREDD